MWDKYKKFEYAVENPYNPVQMRPINMVLVGLELKDIKSFSTISDSKELENKIYWCLYALNNKDNGLPASIKNNIAEIQERLPLIIEAHTKLISKTLLDVNNTETIVDKLKRFNFKYSSQSSLEIDINQLKNAPEFLNILFESVKVGYSKATSEIILQPLRKSPQNEELYIKEIITRKWQSYDEKEKEIDPAQQEIQEKYFAVYTNEVQKLYQDQRLKVCVESNSISDQEKFEQSDLKKYIDFEIALLKDTPDAYNKISLVQVQLPKRSKDKIYIVEPCSEAKTAYQVTVSKEIESLVKQHGETLQNALLEELSKEQQKTEQSKLRSAKILRAYLDAKDKKNIESWRQTKDFQEQLLKTLVDIEIWDDKIQNDDIKNEERLKAFWKGQDLARELSNTTSFRRQIYRSALLENMQPEVADTTIKLAVQEKKLKIINTKIEEIKIKGQDSSISSPVKEKIALLKRMPSYPANLYDYHKECEVMQENHNKYYNELSEIYNAFKQSELVEAKKCKLAALEEKFPKALRAYSKNEMKEINKSLQELKLLEDSMKVNPSELKTQELKDSENKNLKFDFNNTQYTDHTKKKLDDNLCAVDKTLKTEEEKTSSSGLDLRIIHSLAVEKIGILKTFSDAKKLLYEYKKQVWDKYKKFEYAVENPYNPVQMKLINMALAELELEDIGTFEIEKATIEELNKKIYWFLYTCYQNEAAVFDVENVSWMLHQKTKVDLDRVLQIFRRHKHLEGIAMPVNKLIEKLSSEDKSLAEYSIEDSKLKLSINNLKANNNIMSLFRELDFDIQGMDAGKVREIIIKKWELFDIAFGLTNEKKDTYAKTKDHDNILNKGDEAKAAAKTFDVLNALLKRSNQIDLEIGIFNDHKDTLSKLGYLYFFHIPYVKLSESPNTSAVCQKLAKTLYVKLKEKYKNLSTISNSEELVITNSSVHSLETLLGLIVTNNPDVIQDKSDTLYVEYQKMLQTQTTHVEKLKEEKIIGKKDYIGPI